MWNEGVAKAEELGRDKANIADRLAEAEDTINSMQEKIGNLKKSKAQSKAELDGLISETERFNTNWERRQKTLWNSIWMETWSWGSSNRMLHL